MRDATVLDGSKAISVTDSRAESRATVTTYGDLEKWVESWTGTESDVDSGVKVTRKTAFYVPVVWQLASMISGDLAKVPVDKFKRLNNEERETQKDSIWYLLRHQPNDEEHAFYFRRDVFLAALTLGAGYAHIQRNMRGEPASLTWLDPDLVTPERIAGRLWFRYRTVRDGKPYNVAIPNDDMFHVRGMSFDGSAGARMVSYARHTIGLAIARQRYASKFFKHGAKQGGFLHLNPGTTKENQANAKTAVDKWNADENNWHSTAPLRDGHKWVATTIDPRAGQLTEQGEAAVRELCRYFNVAPSRAGLSDSVSYNSKAEDNQSYLDTTLSPWIESEAAEANMKLLSEREKRADTHYFEHNTKVFLKMNAKDEATILGMMVDHAALAPDEWRKKLNMPPRPDGKGMEFKDLNKVAPSGGFDKGGQEQPRGPGDGDSQLDRSDPRRDPKKRVESVRQTFELAAVARDKAAKGRLAFGEFVKVGLRRHADNPLRRALMGADMIPHEDVKDEVDRICTLHETMILGDD